MAGRKRSNLKRFAGESKSEPSYLIDQLDAPVRCPAITIREGRAAFTREGLPCEIINVGSFIDSVHETEPLRGDPRIVEESIDIAVHSLGAFS